MSEPSPSRRLALLLVLFVVSFAIFKCTSMRYTAREDVFCKSGNYSKSKPMICVDIKEKTLTADPPVAQVYDVEPKNGEPSRRPVVIHWFSQRTADLIVTFDPNNECVEQVNCDHTTGHCSATVKNLHFYRNPQLSPEQLKEAAKKAAKRCTYELKLGDSKLDPPEDIVVNPCCW